MRIERECEHHLSRIEYLRGSFPSTVEEQRSRRIEINRYPVRSEGKHAHLPSTAASGSIDDQHPFGEASIHEPKVL